MCNEKLFKESSLESSLLYIFFIRTPLISLGLVKLLKTRKAS
jgi:hypothetical protein